MVLKSKNSLKLPAFFMWKMPRFGRFRRLIESRIYCYQEKCYDIILQEVICIELVRFWSLVGLHAYFSLIFNGFNYIKFHPWPLTLHRPFGFRSSAVRPVFYSCLEKLLISRCLYWSLLHGNNNKKIPYTYAGDFMWIFRILKVTFYFEWKSYNFLR